MTPEFARPHRLDRIGEGEVRVAVAADAGERAALARRFDLVSLDRLEADYALRRDAQGVLANGRLRAEAVQGCIATGVPVPAAVDVPFTLRFLPEGSAEGDEIELTEEGCDTMFHDGAAIDLGEAAAETLALSLDPYPRAPGADAALRAAGVLREDEAGPFSALAALRDRLG